MSYKQNNPLSRKSSPLNGKGDKCPDSGCVQEAGDGKWKVISGQTGKDWPSTFPSRESAEKAIQRYHAGGFSRQPYGGNKGDEKKSVRDYEGPSRKSSSPLNQDERSGRLKPDYSDYEKQQKRHHEETSESVDERSGTRFPGVRDGQRNPETFIKSHPNYISKENWDNATDEQKGISRKSSPLNNTGMTGLNYSKELQYMPIEDDMHRGMSRESSSPLDYGSWAHEDATRAKDLYKKGDYAHARALGIDEHDADYAKHWHKDEAEHGPSRSSSKLREKARKISERTGAEWGDYDYENPRVQRLLRKASRKDERSGK